MASDNYTNSTRALYNLLCIVRFKPDFLSHISYELIVPTEHCAMALLSIVVLALIAKLSQSFCYLDKRFTRTRFCLVRYRESGWNPTLLHQIKSVIDRNGATCRNNNHFEHATILNAPLDAHSRRAQTYTPTNTPTNKHTVATKRVISPASRSIIIIM